MHIGMQLSAAQLERLGCRYLKQLAQLGVHHVAVDPPGRPLDWTRDDLARHADMIRDHGLVLDMIQLPLTSAPIDRAPSPNIMLGRSPERDREIDVICGLIELLAQLGIPAVRYNLNLLGIPRTANEVGRGGSVNSAFRLEAAPEWPLGLAGTVSADDYWERIDYFLARVVPVAEAANIRLACHPHDPCTPPGYGGVDAVLGTVAGLQQFVAMHESRVHGLNFCQGTIAESLADPAGEILDVIHWFGSRDKIFNVHFRNIRGRRYSFVEVFPDEGDMDMTACLRAYRDIGYAHMVMPDHVPAIDAASAEETGFAFALGYTVGLFQSLGLDPYGRNELA